MGLVFPSGTNCTLAYSARAQGVRVCVRSVDFSRVHSEELESDSKQSITPTQVPPAAQATYLVINLLMSYVDVYTEAVVI